MLSLFHAFLTIPNTWQVVEVLAILSSWFVNLLYYFSGKRFVLVLGKSNERLKQLSTYTLVEIKTMQVLRFYSAVTVAWLFPYTTLMSRMGHGHWWFGRFEQWCWHSLKYSVPINNEALFYFQGDHYSVVRPKTF